MKNENKSSVVKPIETDFDKENEVLERATGNIKVDHDGGKGVSDSGPYNSLKLVLQRSENPEQNIVQKVVIHKMIDLLSNKSGLFSCPAIVVSCC